MRQYGRIGALVRPQAFGYITPMLRDIYQICMRALLVLAFIMPVSVSPVMAASGMSASGTSLLCAPSAQISAEAAAALADIRQALGLPPLEDPAPIGSDHCDQCVLVAAIKPRNFSYDAALPALSRTLYQETAPWGFAYLAQGPPLGSRAPPLSL